MFYLWRLLLNSVVLNTTITKKDLPRLIDWVLYSLERESECNIGECKQTETKYDLNVDKEKEDDHIRLLVNFGRGSGSCSESPVDLRNDDGGTSTQYALIHS